MLSQLNASDLVHPFRSPPLSHSLPLLKLFILFARCIGPMILYFTFECAMSATSSLWLAWSLGVIGTRCEFNLDSESTGSLVTGRLQRTTAQQVNTRTTAKRAQQLIKNHPAVDIKGRASSCINSLTDVTLVWVTSRRKVQ